MRRTACISPDELADALDHAGYLPDTGVATAAFLAIGMARRRRDRAGRNGLQAGLAVKSQALAPTVTFVTIGHDDITAPPAASGVAAVDMGNAGTAAGLLDQAAAKGTVTRRCYDIQGLRADADYMFWWTAPSPDDLQETYVRFRRTWLGRASEPVCRCWRCTARRSSARTTPRRSWRARSKNLP
jgi:hypothetical protein